MSSTSVQLPAEVKALAEARASSAGYASVADYVVHLIRGEAAASPEGLSIESEEQLETLLLSRLDGRSTEMDAADFERMRAKLSARLNRPSAPPT